MEKHYGQIVEYWVRKNGYSITDLATELDVNRRSIYNYFQNKYLKIDIILKIGRVIRHDFSKEFPEYFTPEDFEYGYKGRPVAMFAGAAENDSDENWKDKYLNLLEAYNEALITRLNIQILDIEKVGNALVN